MTGRGLLRIARWITRAETFDRMVSPAIADLQFEARYGWLHRWRHYVAIGLVLFHAVMYDFRLDVSHAFDREARRVAWKRAAIWYGASAAAFTFLGFRYDIPWGRIGPEIWTNALTSVGLKALVTSPLLAITVAVVYLYRRASARRSIVAAVLVVAVCTTLAALAVRPLRRSADRALFASVQASIRAASESDRSTADRREVWGTYKAYDLDERFAWWEDIRSGASVIVQALIGLVLAQRRGWGIARRVVCLFATWILMIVFFSPVVFGQYAVSRQSEILDRWDDVTLLFAVAVVWMIYDATLRRIRRQVANG